MPLQTPPTTGSHVFVANDGMEQFLFRNNGTGTFTERAAKVGVALSDDGKPVSGMGVGFRDYDNDGGGVFQYASLCSREPPL